VSLRHRGHRDHGGAGAGDAGEHDGRDTRHRLAEHERQGEQRTRRGRTVYVGLTERSSAILHDGRDRLQGAVNREWDGTWTLLDGLGAEGRVPPTEVAGIVQEAWDLDRLADRYRAFLARWRVPAQVPDSLARHLLLASDWLRTIRDDPRLPHVHLPAEPAEELFHTLSGTLETEARAIVAEVLDTIPDTWPGRPVAGPT
jgi:phenylacetic acid degradation operon negative regulatory protein